MSEDLLGVGFLPQEFREVIAKGLARPDRHENAAGKKQRVPEKCSQCGQDWSAPACGPTHAKIANNLRVAAGKKLCGLCGWKAAGKGLWACTRHIPHPSYEEYAGMDFYPCPAPNGDCPGFLKKPAVTKIPQPKKESLPVPAWDFPWSSVL